MFNSAICEIDSLKNRFRQICIVEIRGRKFNRDKASMLILAVSQIRFGNVHVRAHDFVESSVHEDDGSEMLGISSLFYCRSDNLKILKS